MTTTRTKAPYAAGDQVKVLRDEAKLGTVWGPLTIDRVVPMNDGRTWRLCLTRGDGSALEVYVGRNGRDAHGYVEPARAAS